MEITMVKSHFNFGAIQGFTGPLGTLSVCLGTLVRPLGKPF